MQEFTKVVNPGVQSPAYHGATKPVPVFCKITYKNDRLSITGVEGPKSNGNAIGGCGQINPVECIAEYAEGWDPNMLARFNDIWDRWHLNDMRAGCKHQRAQGWGGKSVNVVSYHLTAPVDEMRKNALVKCQQAGITGVPVELTPAERTLVELKDWFKVIYELPAPDSPLYGLYSKAKEETKLSCWVYPHQHPEGVLNKPCPECGYKYGSAWLFEQIPDDVLQFLYDLPETKVTPAWV